MIFILGWMLHGIFSPETTWGRHLHKDSQLRIAGVSIVALLVVVLLLGLFANSPAERSSEIDSQNVAASESSPSELESEPDEQNASTNPNSEQDKPQTSLVKYSVLDETIDETPGATKVFLDLLVPQETSEAELRDLLEHLYREAKQRSGFKYHEHPTVIGLYAYPSREHAESGMGQWLGMLSKAPMNDKPNISIHASVGKPDTFPNERFGFSEEKRKEIYKDLIRAEDRARVEAERQYPNPSDLNDFQKQSNLQSELREQYDRQLAEKLGLTQEQLREIASEGLQKNWPMPEMGGS